MATYKMAISLGFPHPDLLMESMTARQSMDLFAYLNYESDKAERQRALAEETRMREFMEEKARNGKG